MKRLLVLAFLTGMSLTGCLAGQKTGSLDTLSADHAGDARALAELAATELTERHAPAHTALRLDRAPGAFGETLEAELRRAGFALVPDGGLGISYKLDVLRDQGKPLGYVQVSGTDGQLFSISRKLSDAPVTYTEPPSAQAPSSTLEDRPLPDPVASPGVDPAGQAALAEGPAKADTISPSEAGKVRTVPVSRTATAAAVARRSGVPVDDFCRWNNVGPNAMLIEGYQVYLSEPPAGTIPVAAENPVPAGVAAGTPETTLPAPVPASTTLPAHTSAKLSLPSAPQKAETISYTPPVSSAPVAAPVTAPPAPVTGSREGVFPVSSPAPASAPSGDTAAGPASLPADAEIVPISNPAGMGVRSWEIVKGEMLKAQLERWATDAGYTLIWSAHNDYEMQSNSTFNGPFKDAVKAFFGALQSNGHALRVTIFEGNNVMEVSEH